MNRSARSLLAAAAVAPFAAALGVAAAPANADLGPSTALLYNAAAAAHPVTRTLPEPAVQTGGTAAETATGAVDDVLRAAPGTSGPRSRSARCALQPGKALGAGLPGASLPAAGRTPLRGLSEIGCAAARRADARDRTSGTDLLPVRPGAAVGEVGEIGKIGKVGKVGKAGKSLLKGTGKLGGTVTKGELGGLAGMRSALPAARRADMPVSMALPRTLPGDVPGVTSLLGPAGLQGLAADSMLFPPAQRRAEPAPSVGLLGRPDNAVNMTGANLGRAGAGVGRVVGALGAKSPVARKADGPLSDGPLSDAPLSMPDASALGLRTLPGIG